MAVTHPTAAVRNVMCDAVVDQIDDGGGNGLLILKDSGGNVLCQVTLNSPAFGNAGAGSPGTASLDVTGGLSGTVSSPGTIAEAEFCDSTGVSKVIFQSDDVGTSGNEVVISNTTVAVSDTITITSATYQASV